VAILTFLGRKKCSFLTQEKRPFLGYSSSYSRILTVTLTEQNNCQEDRLFSRRRSPINRERARRRDEDDSLISGSGFTRPSAEHLRSGSADRRLDIGTNAFCLDQSRILDLFRNRCVSATSS